MDRIPGKKTTGDRGGAPPPALRNGVRRSDAGAVRDIVSSTGLFRPDEIGIAVELVEERLRSGPASGYHFLFAERGDRILGYSCYGPVPLTLHCYDLYWIAVRKEAQGMGIGRMLLEHSEKAIAALGGRRVYIETSSRPIYLDTRRFYERNGYRAEAVLKEFYSPGDAKVIYVKALEQDDAEGEKVRR
ncbi:MAG: putative acetyltransferase [Syntrophaceae bacterium PtaB.Bin038]|nr:MAG: putative acetyltransferase [Syntrophaceae bacterium PtaB.Bin038]